MDGWMDGWVCKDALCSMLLHDRPHSLVCTVAQSAVCTRQCVLIRPQHCYLQLVKSNVMIFSVTVKLKKQYTLRVYHWYKYCNMFYITNQSFIEIQ